jgi:cobalamin synthase
MNISPLGIYLITRLDEIKNFMGIVAGTAATLIFLLAVLIIAAEHDPSSAKDKELAKRLKGHREWLISVLILSLTFALLLPTARQAVAMYAIPQAINSRLLQEDVPQAVRDLWEKVIKEGNRND